MRGEGGGRAAMMVCGDKGDGGARFKGVTGCERGGASGAPAYDTPADECSAQYRPRKRPPIRRPSRHLSRLLPPTCTLLRPCTRHTHHRRDLSTFNFDLQLPATSVAANH